MICKHKWRAPYLLPPPSKQVKGIEQECRLLKGHDGPHRSRSNVITSV